MFRPFKDWTKSLRSNDKYWTRYNFGKHKHNFVLSQMSFAFVIRISVQIVIESAKFNGQVFHWTIWIICLLWRLECSVINMICLSVTNARMNVRGSIRIFIFFWRPNYQFRSNLCKSKVQLKFTVSKVGWSHGKL